MSVLGRNSEEVYAVSDPFLPCVWSGVIDERKRQLSSGLTAGVYKGGWVGAGSSQLKHPQIASSLLPFMSWSLVLDVESESPVY